MIEREIQKGEEEELKLHEACNRMHLTFEHLKFLGYNETFAILWRKNWSQLTNSFHTTSILKKVKKVRFVNNMEEENITKGDVRKREDSAEKELMGFPA